MKKSIWYSLLSVISASCIIQLTNSAMMTLTPLQLDGMGFEPETIAIVAAAYSVGYIIGCYRGPMVIGRVGYIRAMAAASAISIMCTLSSIVFEAMLPWLALRCFMGFAIALLFTCFDAWITESAPKADRGAVFAVYASLLAIMAIVSQVLIAMLPEPVIDGPLLLTLGMCSAIIFMTLADSSPPEPESGARMNFREVLRLSPVAIVGSVSGGMTTMIMITMFPWYLIENGVDDNTIGYAIAALFLGRLLFQWPVGVVSDRVDRRYVVAILASACVALTLVILFLGPREGAALSGDEGVLMAVFVYLSLVLLGGTMYPLYSLSLTHAFDRAAAGTGLPTATTMLMCSALGAFLGPIAVSAATPIAGDQSALVVMTGAMATLSLFTFSRVMSVKAHDEDNKSSFVVSVETSLAAQPDVLEPAEREDVPDQP